MVVTLDAKRRLTVPAALAPAMPGDYFDARFDPEAGPALEAGESSKSSPTACGGP